MKPTLQTESFVLFCLPTELWHWTAVAPLSGQWEREPCRVFMSVNLRGAGLSPHQQVGSHITSQHSLKFPDNACWGKTLAFLFVILYRYSTPLQVNVTLDVYHMCKWVRLWRGVLYREVLSVNLACGKWHKEGRKQVRGNAKRKEDAK